MFTAFSDGKISAIISFLRTFGFLVACILLLPKALGDSGVWLAVPVAESLTVFISVWFLLVGHKTKDGKHEYVTLTPEDFSSFPLITFLQGSIYLPLPCLLHFLMGKFQQSFHFCVPLVF